MRFTLSVSNDMFYGGVLSELRKLSNHAKRQKPLWGTTLPMQGFGIVVE